MKLKVLLLFELFLALTTQECIPEKDGCIICGANICVACDQNYGWELSGGSCCQTHAGYFPDSNGGCEACPTLVEGCSICEYDLPSEQVSCSRCNDGQNYFLKPDASCGGCSEVIPHCGGCALINNHTHCMFCVDTFQLSGNQQCCPLNEALYPDYKGGCDTCENILRGCTSCTMNGGYVICKQCDQQNGFSISGTVCCDAKVGENPHENGGCTPNYCSTGCTICYHNHGYYECEECDTTEGYHLSGTICCPTTMGQFPDGDGGCDGCDMIVGCVGCAVKDGHTGCTKCNSEEGYQISGEICCHTISGELPDGNHGCTSLVDCPTGCKTCKQVGQIMECQSCENDYLLAGAKCCNTANDEYAHGSECVGCETIIPGCAHCEVDDEDIFCAQCQVGYEISGHICCEGGLIPDGEGGCSSCPAGCKYCVGETCSQCDTLHGFYLSGAVCCDTANSLFPDSKGGCQACSTLISHCITCTYDVSMQDVRCVDCDDANSYYVSEDGTCATCVNVIPGCAGCIELDTFTQCLFCDTGYSATVDNRQCCDVNSDRYPIANECWSCRTAVPGCQTCAVNGGKVRCTSCDTEGGYNLAGSICCDSSIGSAVRGIACINVSECGAGCLTCTDSKCQRCDTENGYELSGSSCCDTKVGLFPDGNDECKPCLKIHPQCQICEFSVDATFCSLCESGLKLDGNGACTVASDCPVGCSACQQGCTQCESGYALYGSACCLENNQYPNKENICVQCDQIQRGCSVCQFDQQSLTTYCSSCDSNYYLSGIRCCNTKDNQFPSEKGTCQTCEAMIGDCLFCEYSQKDGVDCVLCDAVENKFLKEGSCVECSSKIPGCVSNACRESDGVQCVECEPGFQLAASQRECCSNDQGYYLDKDGSCALCADLISGCMTCQVEADSVVCAACNVEEGYLISGGKCCSSKNEQFPNNKDDCGSCKNVIPGCLSCEASGSVITCESCDIGNGYFPGEEGSCRTCEESIPGCTSCVWNGGVGCAECDTSDSYHLSGLKCCLTAFDSYPDEDGGCSPCHVVISDCTQCEYDAGKSFVRCKSCNEESQKFLDENERCKACPSLIPGCETCSMQSDVLKCDRCETESGFYPNRQESCGSCQSVIEGCIFCSLNSGNTECKACNSGYELSKTVCCNSDSESYPDGNGACQSCDQAIPGCSTCTFDSQASSLACKSCASGYEISGSVCCDISQEFPSPSGACETCTQIIPGCSACQVVQGDTICKACLENYAKSGEICCDSNAGLIPDGNGACSACSLGCKTCVETGENSICIECDRGSGFYISGTVCCDSKNMIFPNGNGECKTCEYLKPDCLACEYQNSQVNCVLCDAVENKFLKEGSCVECSSKIPGCVSNACRESDGVQCVECEPGFQLAASQRECCSNDQGYYLDKDGSCALCADLISGCMTCQVEADSVVCAACNVEEGYLISGGKCCSSKNEQFPNNKDDCGSCKNVIPGCLSCEASGSVITCESCDIGNGYFPGEEGSCRTCEESIPGCTSCVWNGGVGCAECDTSDSYHLSGLKCCLTAFDSYPDEDGGCSPCHVVISDCTQCEYDAGKSFVRCKSCNEESQKFLDENERCKACPSLIPGCETCSMQSDVLKCDRCETESGFYPNRQESCGSCQSVIEGCIFCSLNSGNTECKACNSGYELSKTVCCNSDSESYPDGNGACQSCDQAIPGCSTCTFDSQASSLACKSCASGYEISGSVCCDISQEFPSPSGACETCTQIIPGCSACQVVQGDTICKACLENYAKSGEICCDSNAGLIPDGNGACSACSLGCKTCVETGENSICIECDRGSGFYISGTVCCDSKNMIFPNGNGECKTCEYLKPDCLACEYQNSQVNCVLCDAVENKFLKEGSCVECSSKIPGCVSNACRESDGVQCVECEPGFQLAASQRECCSNDQGYYLDKDGSCALCADLISGCMTCQVEADSVVCAACNVEEGYLISGGKCCSSKNEQFPNNKDDCGSCKNVIPGCLSCEASGSVITCESCDIGNGYFPGEEGSCRTCEESIPGCTSCVWNGGVGCAECDTSDSYHLSGLKCCLTAFDSYPDEDGGCSPCHVVISDCTQCEYDAGKSFVRCKSCNEESQKFLDENERCKACPSLIPGCETCSMQSDVLKCDRCETESGFYPNRQESCGSCQSVIEGCIFCSLNSGNTECKACNSGYELSKTVCCNSDSESYPDGNGACQSCDQAIPGCSTCTFDSQASSLACKSCASGYEISGSVCCDISQEFPSPSGACETCTQIIPGCSACQVVQGDTICKACLENYAKSGEICCDSNAGLIPDGNGACSACSLGCKTCVETGENSICIECDRGSGFYISGTVCCDSKNMIFPNGNGECKTCEYLKPDCLACEYQNSQVNCVLCDAVENKFLKEGSCVECSSKIPGCVSNACRESDGVQCVECEPGFQLAASQRECCSNDQGYYLDKDGSCALCADLISGCMTCQVEADSVVCAACNVEEGYLISGGKCCSSKNEQFPNNKDDCGSCKNVIPGCLSCEASGSVITCESCDIGNGYFPGEEGSCRTCEESIPGCTSCVWNGGVGCAECDTSDSYHLSGLKCCLTAFDSYPDEDGGCSPCHVVISDCTQCEYDAGKSFVRCKSCNEESQKFLDENERCKACPSLIPGCETCSMQSDVLKCDRCETESGFYPNRQESCGSCQSVIEGCIFCSLNSGNTECKACNSGYELSKTVCCNSDSESYPDGNGACQSCDQAIPGCSTCTFDSQASSLACKSCASGYEISGSVCCDISQEFPSPSGACETCTQIIPGCSACQVVQGDTICKACLENYAKSGEICCDSNAGLIPDGNGACSACSLGCKTCVETGENSICIECDRENGFQLSGIICCSTEDNLFPNNQGGCSQCSNVILNCPNDHCMFSGFDTICTNCLSIIPYCQKCRILSVCLECTTDSYIDESKCSLCSDSIPNCIQCSNSRSCTSCQAGYALIDNSICQLCLHNEVLSSTGDSCVPCSDINPNCVSCSDQNICTYCGRGFSVKADGSGCYKCDSIDAKCTACSSDLVCTQCLTNYRLSNNVCDAVPMGTKGMIDIGGQKNDCPAGCSSCSDIDTCTLCSDGFGLEDSLCIACDPSCKACSTFSTTCTECYSSNYLQDSQCQPCQNNCLICTETECLTCSDGFYPDGSRCRSCPAFCSKCISNLQCQKCDVGFTSKDGSCVRCVTGCTSCQPDNITLCLGCAEGYYRSGGACHICSKHCLVCSGESDCQICESGYILQADNSCYEACRYPCFTCSPLSPDSCLSCMGGHTLSANTCIPDDCNQTASCVHCPRQQFISRNNCEFCESDCDFCVDVDTCTQCSPGFFLEDDSCSPCPSGCSTCSSNQNCDSCSNGYYQEHDDGKVKTGKCKPCSSQHHCKECRGTASSCTSCEDNYQFLQLICVRKMRIRIELEIDISFSEFLIRVHEFQIAFMEAFQNTEFSGNTELFHVTRIEEGSAVVHGQLDVEQKSATKIYETISKFTDMNSISSYFPVLSLKQEAIGWKYVPDEKTPTQMGFPLYAIILIVLLPLLIISLGIKMACSSQQTSNTSDKVLTLSPRTTSDTDKTLSRKAL